MDKKDVVGRGEKIKLSVRVAVLELCLWKASPGPYLLTVPTQRLFTKPGQESMPC